MIQNSQFKPAWWLANPHLQTIWPFMMRPEAKLTLWRERLDLPDGDFVDLDCTFEYKKVFPKKLVLILHGIGGNIESHYAKSTMAVLKQNGYDSVFMHFRGASGVPNRLHCTYHADRIQDIDDVINVLHQRISNLKLAVIGFSMGGGMLLKWLGTYPHTDRVQTTIAVSVPFEVEKVCNRIQYGFSRFYQNHLIKKLRDQFSVKLQHGNLPIPQDVFTRIKTFQDFDREITVPLNKMDSVEKYYQQASCRQYLKDVKIPSLIIHAADDPFMYPDIVPQPHELSSNIELELSSRGGHVGFIGGNIPGKPIYYLEQRIPEFLKNF